MHVIVTIRGIAGGYRRTGSPDRRHRAGPGARFGFGENTGLFRGRRLPEGSTPRGKAAPGKPRRTAGDFSRCRVFFRFEAVLDKTHQFWTPRISTAVDGRVAAVHLGAVEATTMAAGRKSPVC